MPKQNSSLPVGPHSKISFSPRMQRAKRTQFMWGVWMFISAVIAAGMGYAVFIGPFVLAGILCVILAWAMGRGLSELLRWALGLAMLGAMAWVLMGLSFLGGGPAPIDSVKSLIGGM